MFKWGYPSRACGLKASRMVPILQAQVRYVCILGTITAEYRLHGSDSADIAALRLQNRKSASPAAPSPLASAKLIYCR